jgi:uncharacterized HAD superfamily protein
MDRTTTDGDNLMARVGFDIDGVLYDFEDALRDYLTEQGCLFDMPVATQWHFAEQWGLTPAEFDDWCREALRHGRLFSRGTGFPGVREQLQRIKYAGHKIVLITARDFGNPLAAREQTLEWLDGTGIPYDELWMRSAKEKASIPVDYFIDDNVEVCHRMIEAGVKAFLCNRPYNRHQLTLHRGHLGDYVDKVLDCERQIRTLPKFERLATDPLAAERADILDRFNSELKKATGDGSKKRKAGEKPPWYDDNSHEAAIFSHLMKWKRGEKVDPDSGAHPLVHAAWRCLAIACQESGNVPVGTPVLTDPARPSEAPQNGPERPNRVRHLCSGTCTCSYVIGSAAQLNEYHNR